ncbi:endopeptidase IV [Legionella longbeachae]|uniref:Enhanced entry protein EnhB n=2 Tax=Legionella longbeachae TaxID=450 RepID=D3HKW2_LEGLN|nr:endopeptidase IV [Legionella longbeachae]EEZ93790.1 enhanced entry protein EnhB [Legionella longbeachae D-4968]CBJ13078.1 enhanced entry protein EnhB [Legionella longbeachae NSW150]VEE03590.1 enhanced entry protein EnhB [Legionella oakridgensis]ARM33338.1 endopeptidase IV [Legionella longbeachae]
MMNTIKKFTSISLIIFLGLLSTQLDAATKSKKNKEDGAQVKSAKEETRFPIGCRPVGYKESLKILSLYPGKEGALQSLYFFFNKLPQTVSLYQMRDEDSEYSTRVNHSIGGNQWAVLATGEPLVKFICTLGDGKTSYGKILDCADTIKVCEYVNVKFGLNNKGNYWIVDGATRNEAVNGVVHYGIIPGV